MVFPSSKTLIQRYKEHRLYATEVVFSRNDEPQGLFVFLPERNAEVRLTIERCLKKKPIRSRDETLYLVQLSFHESVLLMIDHVRGNDYIYCKQKTYDRICAQFDISDWTSPESNAFGQGQAAAARDTSIVPVPISASTQPDFRPQSYSRKIVFMESSIVFHFPELAELLIERNEIILSPYYSIDLEIAGDQSLSGSAHSELVAAAMIERLKARYPEQFITDLYVDQDSHPRIELGLESDYLYALARQQNLAPSQVLFLTTDENFERRMRFLGYEAYSLKVLRDDVLELVPFADSTLSAEYARPPEPLSSLPPRSQRKNKKKRGFWTQMANSLKSMF